MTRRALPAAVCLLLSAAPLLAAGKASIAPRLAEPALAQIASTSSSQSPSARKIAGLDTFVLYGGPGTLEGKFQASTGAPDWQGWQTKDATELPNFWQISTYNAANLGGHGAGNHAYWCGRTEEQAPYWVHTPGYGSSWDTAIFYESDPVADPSIGQDVVLDFFLNHDTEPGYDFVVVEGERDGQWVRMHDYYVFDGTNHDGYGVFPPPGVRFTDEVPDPFSYVGNDYGGPNQDRIRLRIRFLSDGAFDDQTGLWPTHGGAAQVDDFSVTHTGGSFFEDFEGPGPYLLKPWQQPFAGDFAEIYPEMSELDPYRENPSAVAAFVDRGQDVRNGPDQSGATSTGGSTSTTWSYGLPGGFVVNYSGGLTAGPDAVGIENEIWSPMIAWDLPGTDDDDSTVQGAILRFDVYSHLPVDNGIFYMWKIGGGGDYLRYWADDNALYYDFDGPRWQRFELDISEQLATSPPDSVRVGLTVIDASRLFGLSGGDGTPAPFFDNVELLKYRLGGPRIVSDERRLPQNAFPTQGIDPSTIELRAIMDIFLRAESAFGSASASVWDFIDDQPLQDVRMVWALKKSPLFEDSIRLVPATATDENVVTGPEIWTGEQLVVNSVNERHGFDRPLPGAFYPGDQLEFYFRATDSQNRVTTLPADLTGFGAFDGSFDRRFALRGLPTFFDHSGAHPPVLVHVAGGDRADLHLIRHSLGQLGMHEGVDFDVFYVPRSSSTQTLGWRTGAHQLAGYETILSFSGGGGDFPYDQAYFKARPTLHQMLVGFDEVTLTLLDSWFNQPGDRRIVHFGSWVANALATGGGFASEYLDSTLGLDFISSDLRPQIGNALNPSIHPLSGLFSAQFMVAGTKELFAAVEHVESRVGAVRMHGFGLPGGGTHPTAAASTFRGEMVGNDTKLSFSFPFAFRFIQDSAQQNGNGLSARTRLLGELLDFLGAPEPSGPPTAAPAHRAASVRVAPNPFNPQTMIELSLPRAGRASVQIYDLRGRLIRALFAGQALEGTRRIPWDGEDDAGSRVASGVYVLRVMAPGVELEQKLLLLK